MSLRGRRRLGFLVWLIGLVIAIAWALATPSQNNTWPAQARATTFEVAAIETGRLQTVAVQLHQDVVAGDLIAELDPSSLRALREISAAEFLAIGNADAAAPDTHVDAVKKRAATLQLQTELALLDREIDGLRQLVTEGAASQSEVDDRMVERTALVARIRAKQAEAGQDALQGDIGPSAWAVVAALKRLESVDTRLEQLKLTTGLSGRVSAVLRHSGEVVRRGDPIVQIRQTASNEVVAYVPAHRVPSTGATSVVLRADGTELTGSVVSVSPGPDLVPEAIWTVPGRPEHAVAVLVRVDNGEVTPNEPLRVRL